jgi:hypothetical protein
MSHRNNYFKEGVNYLKEGEHKLGDYIRKGEHDLINEIRKIEKKQHQPNYKLSISELKCYAQNNPDLAANGIVSNQQLQQHWKQYGANQQRNNQCPSYQKSSGLYNYVGCFENVNGYRFRANVNSINECQQIANHNGDMSFALYNGNVCSTNATNSNNYSANTGDYRTFNRDLCGLMGTSSSAQIYVRGKPFPPLTPQLPSLQTQNFSDNSSSN